MKSLSVLLLFLSAPTLFGATYYVASTGNNSNTGTQQSPWRTIDYAADRVSGGDIVVVQPGTYVEIVTPGSNGTSVTSMVTFVASGIVQVRGWAFNNSSFIRVVGFSIDTTLGGNNRLNGCVEVTDTCRYMEFWHNTMQNANYNGIRTGTGGRLDNSVIVGNTFRNFGIGNGSGMAIGLRGNDTLVYYNEISNSHPDGATMFGDRNRWVGNYVYGLSEASGGHTDVFQTGSGSNPDGWERNIIEATFYVAGGSQGDEHVAQLSHGQGATQPMTENIFRRNVWHNVSQGTIGVNQTHDGAISYTRIYNNTTAEACENSPDTRYGYAIYGPLTSHTFLINNLEYESWGNNANTNLEVYYVTGVQTIDYNLAYDPDGPVGFRAPFSTQAHPRSNVNPRFVDYANDDFRLGAASGAIDTGGALASVTSASGSGTTFTVSEAGFFAADNTSLTQYSGNLVVGDTITVGTDVVTIASISGNSITVTQSFSWSLGDPVFFGNDSTPDIGAYPASHVPLTAAAIAANGSSYTVVPNGDTRWVVFYQDDVPHTVANTAPYTATITSGSVTARAFPLYASKILSVQASSGEVLPAPSALQLTP